MLLAIAYILLCIALVFRPCIAGFVFTAVALAFQIFCDGFPGAYYYPAAALADLLVIIICSSIGYHAPERAMIKISFLSILNNCAGWILFVTHTLPTTYNVVSLIIYGLAIVAILLTGGSNELDGNPVHRTSAGRNSASWRGNHHKENPR